MKHRYEGKLVFRQHGADFNECLYVGECTFKINVDDLIASLNLTHEVDAVLKFKGNICNNQFEKCPYPINEMIDGLLFKE